MADQFDKVFAATLSDMGPLAVPYPLDLRTVQELNVDFTDENERGKIDFISGVYVNNWNGSRDIHITPNYPNGSIVVPAFSWAYLPLLCANPPKLRVTTPAGLLGAFVEAIFYNIPLPPFVQRRYAAPAAP